MGGWLSSLGKGAGGATGILAFRGGESAWGRRCVVLNRVTVMGFEGIMGCLSVVIC